jgi:tripartite-type tricarboxylate transporter receptor subunit TctC
MQMVKSAGGICAALFFLIAPVHAQQYPQRAVHVIVPFTAGSPVDVAARIVAQHLQKDLGQTFIVENKPGAGTTIGTRDVSRAAPDGYTLLFTGSPLTYYEVLYPKFKFDPTTNLTPIGTAVTWSHLMAVRKDFPAKSVSELVSYAKAHPGTVKFGYGLGTTPHILAAAFKEATAADITLVSYKGGEQARADLLGGHVDINMAPVSNLLPLIKSGELKAIAFSGKKRSSQLPDVPTMAESGYPQVGFDPDVWLGLFAPSGAPTSVVTTLSEGLDRATKDAEFEKAIGKLGFEPATMKPDAFRSFIQLELKNWPPRLRAAGLQPQD